MIDGFFPTNRKSNCSQLSDSVGRLYDEYQQRLEYERRAAEKREAELDSSIGKLVDRLMEVGLI